MDFTLKDNYATVRLEAKTASNSWSVPLAMAFAEIIGGVYIDGEHYHFTKNVEATFDVKWGREANENLEDVVNRKGKIAQDYLSKTLEELKTLEWNLKIIAKANGKKEVED